MSTRYNEAETRLQLIDPLLAHAGWNLDDRRQVGREIPFVSAGGSKSEAGITDYCLYRPNGEVLAVIEAKRTRRDARAGKEQVLEYVVTIAQHQSFRPFAFLANGYDVFFWDTEHAPERRVAGLFTRENLERLLWLRQHRQPLSAVPINTSIAGRAYQVEAIRRVGEAVDQQRRRKALLVMATGTGKTRTTIALLDVFLRAHAAQRVLFLADRDSLVDQALTDGFAPFLPGQSRERLYAPRLADPQDRVLVMGARVLVSTLQTLSTCYREFSPADFDLIVADECHRSIYNKFQDILAYFDAIQIGLTATPASFLDRNTFRFFEADGHAPTFLYEYEQAIEEGYLAPYRVYAAQTRFQRHGIRGLELSDDDQETLRANGLNPEDINYEGTDLERKVTNHDTLRRQWDEFMTVCHKDAGGQLPAKTIVFAVTHAHAIRLEEAFNAMYPEHGGQLARVIDSQTERAKSLLDKFKKQSLPRIAISVDMLDTGVDVPEVMNLAFLKPVGSRIKFLQMIGRGTRSQAACKQLDWLPGRRKEAFLIIDFWENFAHFDLKPANEDDEAGPAQIPVLVSIFQTRLSKLTLLLKEQNAVPAPVFNPEPTPASPLRLAASTPPEPDPDGKVLHPLLAPSTLPQLAQAAEPAAPYATSDLSRLLQALRADLARVPMDSFTVRSAWPVVQAAWEANFWDYITPVKLEFLRLKVAPLLRFVPGVNIDEAFFISKIERCGLALLKGQELTTHVEALREDASLLPTSLPQVAAQRRHRDALLGAEFWQRPTLTRLDEVRDHLAPLMRHRDRRPSLVVELGLDDLIDSRRWVVTEPGGPRLMVEDYRTRVEARVRYLAQEHPTIQRLQAGEPVTLADLAALEQTLQQELASPEKLGLTLDNVRKTFGVQTSSLTDLLRHLLGLQHLTSFEDLVRQSFDAFISAHGYSAEQTRFLRTVQQVLLTTRHLHAADLYEPPFSNFGLNAVEKLFSQQDIEELLEMAQGLVK